MAFPYIGSPFLHPSRCLHFPHPGLLAPCDGQRVRAPWRQIDGLLRLRPDVIVLTERGYDHHSADFRPWPVGVGGWCVAAAVAASLFGAAAVAAAAAGAPRAGQCAAGG
eukprot:gene11796-66424_t